jgi:hypothetical protein
LVEVRLDKLIDVILEPEVDEGRAASRKIALSLTKAISVGLNSGLSGVAPAASIASRLFSLIGP